MGIFLNFFVLRKTNAKNAKASKKCFFVQSRGFLLWRRSCAFMRVSFFFLSFFVSFFVTSQNSRQVGKDDDDDDQNGWSLRIILLTCQERVPRFEKKSTFVVVWSKWHSKKKDHKNAWHEIRAQKKSSIALARSRNVKVVV